MIVLLLISFALFGMTYTSYYMKQVTIAILLFVGLLILNAFFSD